MTRIHRRTYTRTYTYMYISVALAMLLSGCTAGRRPMPLASGEAVSVTYACRLADGSLAATNRQEAGEDGTAGRSVFFAPPKSYVPLTLVAGIVPEGEAKALDASFEDAVRARLTSAVVGMVPDEAHSVTLTAEILPNRTGKERFLDVSRVRHRAQQMTLSATEYEARKGNRAQIGDRFTIDPTFPGSVEEVTADKVTIRFKPVSEPTIPTPYGPGMVSKTTDQYEVLIQAPVGHLVRTGPLVGRVSRVTDTYMTIDYGHPFGGEALFCDVEVRRLPAGTAAVTGEPK